MSILKCFLKLSLAAAYALGGQTVLEHLQDGLTRQKLLSSGSSLAVVRTTLPDNPPPTVIDPASILQPPSSTSSAYCDGMLLRAKHRQSVQPDTAGQGQAEGWRWNSCSDLPIIIQYQGNS